MSLTVEVWSALLRGACIALLALAIAQPVRTVLQCLSRRARRGAWLLLLLPYLTPVLLVGYAYSSFSLSLIHYPRANEVLYDALVLLKLVPVAVLVLHLYPSPVSPEALHCHRILQVARGIPARLLSSLKFRLRASAGANCVAFALVFLFAFGEFEMASLLGTGSWTVKLFDAQAGGLLLGESLYLALLPVALEAALLGAVLGVLYRGRRSGALPGHLRAASGRGARAAVWGYLGLAAGVLTVLPAFLVLRGTFEGLRVLTENFVLARDIGASVLFALGASVCAYLGAGWFAGRIVSGRRARTALLWTFLLCVPGLLGALLLSLLVLSVFQLPGLHAAYDTPVPLLGALVLLIFPFALVLRILLHSQRPGEALHLAGMLKEAPAPSSRRNARRLVWEMKSSRLFWVAFLLFCWAYFDMTASSLLSPSNMTPVLVRLYNLMHYGQMAVLSAMVCAAFLVPLVFLCIAWAMRGLLARLYLHG